MDELGPASVEEVVVPDADSRRVLRPRVKNVWLSLCGRDGNFSATIEPDREDAVIGAIVLEELDLIVVWPAESVHPRDPDHVVELE